MKLSIIVTTYNIENYIEQCLKSIVNQTLQDIEIIVVDDASTDNTANLVKDFAQKDSRIKTVIFEQNTIGGVSSAANAGLDIASGDYVGFADGDDWYELDMFERLFELAESDDADIAFCNYLEFDESNNQNKVPSDAKKWPEIQPFIGKTNVSDDFKRKLLRLNPVPWRKIYRRSWLEMHHIRFPVGDYFFEDNPFHWQSTVLASKIVFDDFIGCYHRINRPGQSMARADRKLLAMYEHHQTILDILNTTASSRFYEQSFGWLVGNTCWIARKIEPEFMHELFVMFKQQVLSYPLDWVKSLLNTSVLGRYGSDLVKTIIEDDYEAFYVVAKGKKAKLDNHQPNSDKSPPPNSSINSLVAQSIHTYKSEGLKALLKKIKAYLEYRYNLKLHSFFWVSNRRLLKELQVIKKESKAVKQEVQILKVALLLQQKEHESTQKTMVQRKNKISVEDEV